MRNKFIATFVFSFFLVIAFSSFANAQTYVIYGYSIIVWDDAAPQRVSGLAGSAVYGVESYAAVGSCLKPVNGQCMSEGNLFAYPYIDGYHPTFYALSNQTYCVNSRHGTWVLGFYNYRFSTSVCHTFPIPPPTPTPTPTPDCEPLAEGALPPPCVTPTPTPPPNPLPSPTPAVKVNAVGFSGDKPIRQFNVLPGQPIIDESDGTVPTWARTDNPKHPVAYVRGPNASVTLFVDLGINPAQSTPRNATLQIKKGPVPIATNIPVSIVGGAVRVSGISIPFSRLESGQFVKMSEYEFIWEISFDNGATWALIGESGKHEVHWLAGEPDANPFRNAAGTPYSGLFDEALKWSTGRMKSDKPDSDVIKKINDSLSARTKYTPSQESIENENPLLIISDRGDKKAQCEDNALIFAGLMKSIGFSSAQIKYHWGGDPVTGKRNYYDYIPGDLCTSTNSLGCRKTLQVTRDELMTGGETVEKNPHFTFHATVNAQVMVDNVLRTISYDPSYGKEEPEVKFIEALETYQENGETRSRFKTGNSATSFRVTMNSFGNPSLASNFDSRRRCSHRYNSGHADARDYLFNDSDGGEIAVVRSSDWIIQDEEGNLSTISSYLPTNNPLIPADYDGDGITDPAVRENGRWRVMLSTTGQLEVYYTPNHLFGDKTVTGDFDADHKADFGTWNSSNGKWVILRSSDGGEQVVNWGVSGDIPVPGDYDGDNRSDFAIWRPSEGKWYIIQSSDGAWLIRSWGQPGDIPVQGDYDGDGLTDTAVVRPSTGIWYSLDSGDNLAWRVYQFDVLGPDDLPVPSDYDSDGRIDIAVWKKSTGFWRIVSSRLGTIREQTFSDGGPSDIPVMSAYVFR